VSNRADYSRSVGGEALGARLRRLAERIDGEVARIYASRGIAFEQRWYSVLNQIVLNGPVSIGDAAAALRITHVSVSQAASSLDRAGYICARADPADGRRRLLQLTAEGERLVADLAPLWRALATAAATLNEEAGDVVGLLDRLDDALDARSLSERVHVQGDIQTEANPAAGAGSIQDSSSGSALARARPS
jgi:DNA-binding MarR family transcriptional regulator